MKKLFLFALLTGIFSNFYGQITTSVNPSISAMQALLQGNGVVVSGLTITCPTNAYATFNNGAAALGGSLNSGILLTTGNASNVAGPNTSSNNLSYDNGAPGSTIGNNLSGGTTYDGCYINFLITPSCATLSINYVFASEEYPEYSVGSINDVFGFVINGTNPAGGNYTNQNIATLPGTTTPVSIQNVNDGLSNTGPCKNCAYYIPTPPGLAYDGATTVLTASCTVVPCSTYTMTIGVWDDSDGILDSGVFLDVNGLSCANQPSLTATASPTTMCGPQTVTLSVTGGFAIGSYTWSAPASGGLASTSGSVVTANPTGATTYTVKYSDINTCPGLPVTQTVAVAFTAPPALPVSQSPAGTICAGQTKTLTASGGAGTYSWTPGASLSTTTNSVTVATPTITTTYTVTKTVGACVSSTVITVTVTPSPTVAITPSLSTICTGQSQTLTASGAGPFAWTASTGANPPAAGTVTVSPVGTTSYTVIAGTGTCTNSAVATVSVGTPPPVSITPSVSTICLGQSQALTASGTAPYTWAASTGTAPPAAANVTVTPSSTTTYTVISGAGTCTSSAVATVSISPSVTISITPSNTTICSGQSAALSSTGAGPFTWTASTGPNPTSAANVTVTPSSTTTYTVLSGTGSCTAQAVATVSVSPSATVAITPSVSTICTGQSQALSASGAGPFTWTASSGANPASIANVTVTPGSTTTYTVLSGTGSCTAIATATVNIGTPPPVNITPTGTMICLGESTGLTASGTGPYVWSASTGTAPASAANVTVTPSSTTTYTVVSGVGTCTSSAVTTVSIAPTLTINVTPSNTTICLGENVGLSSTGAGPFTWTASVGANPASAANVTVTPSSTTTYTVLSGTGACTAQAVATVSIAPTLTINVTPSNTTICLGQSVALSSTGAGPFTWTASAGANPASVANVTVTPGSTTTYTVLSGTGACTAQAVATVSVGATPPINITPSNTIICLGDSVGLSSTGVGPFTWTASVGASPASAANVTVTPGATTTYTVLSGTGACTAQAVATVSISPALTINITPTSTIICNGQAANLSTAGTASVGPFAWTASVGANPSSTGNVTVNPTSTTTYTVLAGTGACTAQAVATVSVSPTLTITITPSNTTVCNGSGTTLTAGGATSYTWSQGSAATSISVTPVTTSTYAVVGTDGVCVNSATATVSVISLTTSVIASSPYYCIGVSPVSLTGSGATTYSWSGSGLNSTTGAVVTATPSSTSIYTVTGTTSGCTSTQTISLNVPPISTITASANNTVICVGGSGSTLTANGSNTYTWSPGTPTQTLAVNPITTTSYTVTGQSAAGCFEIPAVITVSVLPSINPSVTISSPTVCITKTVSISVPSAAGLTYTWQPTTAILGANNTNSIIAMPPSTATVIYTVTISNGVCAGTNTVQLQVKTPPDITNFTTLNNDTICTGGCVTFSATATGSMPIYYQWYYQSGVGTSSVGVAPEACYPSAGSFSVVATASNTCGFDTLTKTNFVTVFDIPTLVVYGDTTINIGETATVYATGGVTYNWSPNINGNTITCVTCSSTVVQPTLTTQYIVVASNSPYCKVQDTVTVTVDINCGDFFIPNVFSPNDDGLNDVINVHGRCISTFNLQIFNRWGEKVFETSSLESSWDGSFRGKKMDTGVFVYKADGVSIDGQSFKMKGNITLIR